MPLSHTLGADYDRCRVMLVLHVDCGEVNGTEVSGLIVAAVADTPKVMSEGGWRLGVVIDEAADVGVEDVVPSGSEGNKPAKLTDTFHPANSTLGVAKAGTSTIDLFGLQISNEAKSAFARTFSWAS